MKKKFKVKIKKKFYLGTLKTLGYCTQKTLKALEALQHLRHLRHFDGIQELELLVHSKDSGILGHSRHLSSRALKGHMGTQAFRWLEQSRLFISQTLVFLIKENISCKPYKIYVSSLKGLCPLIAISLYKNSTFKPHWLYCKYVYLFVLVPRTEMIETGESKGFALPSCWFTLDLPEKNYLSLGVPEKLNFYYNHKKEKIISPSQR